MNYPQIIKVENQQSEPFDLSGKDYYEILEIETTASVSEIKAAYRRLAKKYHPDTQGPEATDDNFKLLSVAYGVLIDPQRRALYDQHKENWSTFREEPTNNVSYEDIRDWFQRYSRGSLNTYCIFDDYFPDLDKDIHYDSEEGVYYNSEGDMLDREEFIVDYKEAKALGRFKDIMEAINTTNDLQKFSPEILKEILDTFKSIERIRGDRYELYSEYIQAYKDRLPEIISEAEKERTYERIAADFENDERAFDKKIVREKKRLLQEAYINIGNREVHRYGKRNSRK